MTTDFPRASHRRRAFAARLVCVAAGLTCGTSALAEERPRSPVLDEAVLVLPPDVTSPLRTLALVQFDVPSGVREGILEGHESPLAVALGVRAVGLDDAVVERGIRIRFEPKMRQLHIATCEATGCGNEVPMAVPAQGKPFVANIDGQAWLLSLSEDAGRLAQRCQAGSSATCVVRYASWRLTHLRARATAGTVWPLPARAGIGVGRTELLLIDTTFNRVHFRFPFSPLKGSGAAAPLVATTLGATLAIRQGARAWHLDFASDTATLVSVRGIVRADGGLAALASPRGLRAKRSSTEDPAVPQGALLALCPAGAAFADGLVSLPSGAFQRRPLVAASCRSRDGALVFLSSAGASTERTWMRGVLLPGVSSQFAKNTKINTEETESPLSSDAARGARYFSLGDDGSYVHRDDGFYLVTRSGVARTSLSAFAGDAARVEGHDALVREGKGAACTWRHLSSREGDPASWTESGLRVPCASHLTFSSGPGWFALSWPQGRGRFATRVLHRTPSLP